MYGPLPVFEFHSGFWVNLHHFLYHEARAPGGKRTARRNREKSRFVWEANSCHAFRR